MKYLIRYILPIPLLICALCALWLATSQADEQHVALIDGITPEHARLMINVLNQEGVDYQYYELQPSTVERLNQLLDEVRLNNERVIVIEVCLIEHFGGVSERLRLLQQSGATVIIPACYRGDTILNEYAEYGVVVSALDYYGKECPSLNNGPEVNDWVWGCMLGRCSTSEAGARYAARIIQ